MPTVGDVSVRCNDWITARDAHTVASNAEG